MEKGATHYTYNDIFQHYFADEIASFVKENQIKSAKKNKSDQIKAILKWIATPEDDEDKENKTDNVKSTKSKSNKKSSDKTKSQKKNSKKENKKKVVEEEEDDENEDVDIENDEVEAKVDSEPTDSPSDTEPTQLDQSGTLHRSLGAMKVIITHLMFRD